MAPPLENGWWINGFFTVHNFVAFYFFSLPHKKKTKQHQKMINALEKGDSIKTIGGGFGKITGVKDDRVVVQIMKMLRLVAKEAVRTKVD